MRSYWVLSYTNTLTPKDGGTPTDDEGRQTPAGRLLENRSSYLEQQQPSPRARGVEYCEPDSRPAKCLSGSTEESD